jgi:hypothetical protein
MTTARLLDQAGAAELAPVKARAPRPSTRPAQRTITTEGGGPTPRPPSCPRSRPSTIAPPGRRIRARTDPRFDGRGIDRPISPGPGNDPQDLDQAGAPSCPRVEVARPTPPAVFGAGRPRPKNFAGRGCAAARFFPHPTPPRCSPPPVPEGAAPPREAKASLAGLSHKTPAHPVGSISSRTRYATPMRRDAVARRRNPRSPSRSRRTENNGKARLVQKSRLRQGLIGRPYLLNLGRQRLQ